MLVLQQHGTHRGLGRIIPLVDPHEAQATPRRSEERTTSQVTTCLCAITNTSFELKITMLAALQETQLMVMVFVSHRCLICMEPG